MSSAAARPKRAAAARTEEKIIASLKTQDHKINEAELLAPAGRSPGKKAKASPTAPTAPSAATVTNPAPFKLERYFGVHEFTAKVLLSSSDVESAVQRLGPACPLLRAAKEKTAT